MSRAGTESSAKVEADPPRPGDVRATARPGVQSSALPARVSESRSRRASRSAPSRTSPQRASQPGSLRRIAILQWPVTGRGWPSARCRWGRRTGPSHAACRRTPPRSAAGARRRLPRRSPPVAASTMASRASSRACADGEWRRRARRRTTSSESPSPTRQSGRAKSASTSRAPTSSFRSVAPSPSTAARRAAVVAVGPLAQRRRVQPARHRPVVWSGEVGGAHRARRRRRRGRSARRRGATRPAPTRRCPRCSSGAAGSRTTPRDSCRSDRRWHGAAVALRARSALRASPARFHRRRRLRRCRRRRS